MIFTLSSVLNSDGPARFKGCFVNLLVPEKAPKLMYVRELDNERLSVHDSVSGRLDFSARDPVSIETVMPHTAWKQCGKGCILIERVPARQWRRSLSSSTHKITREHEIVPYGTKDKKELSDIVYPSLNIDSLANLDSALSAPPNSVEGSLELFKNGYFSSALSDKFYLNRNGALFLFNLHVAQVYFKQRSYKVLSVFSEEVRDLLRTLTYKEVVTDDYSLN